MLEFSATSLSGERCNSQAKKINHIRLNFFLVCPSIRKYFFIFIPYIHLNVIQGSIISDKEKERSLSSAVCHALCRGTCILPTTSVLRSLFLLSDGNTENQTLIQ